MTITVTATAEVTESCSPDFYYVDSVNGDDGGDGSFSYPWKTIAKLMTAFAAGETAMLAKGSHWDEQLNIPGDNCSVYSYGTGDSPVLDCSEAISAGSWSKTGGRTYVYQADVTIVSHASTTWVSAWENNTRMVRATSIANCDATANSYFPSADNADNITLYVHASDGSNPGVNGKTYEYSKRQQGVYARDVTGFLISGITTRRNLQNDGSLVVGPHSIVIDCSANEGSKHCALLLEGSQVHGLTALDSYYGESYISMIILFSASASGETSTFTDCTAELTTLSPYAIGFSVEAASGTFGSITYDTCTVTNCSNGWNVGEHPDYFINCTTVNCYVGIVNYGDIEISGGNYGCINQAIKPGSASLIVTVDGAVLTATAAGWAPVYVEQSGCTITVTDTTINGNWYDFYVTQADVTLNMNGNTYNLTNFNYYQLEGADPVLTSDYNDFNSGDAHGFNIGGTTYASVTLYKAGTGQDEHSTVG